MSANGKRTVRGEVHTRDQLPRNAEEGDAYIVVRDAAIVVRRNHGWETVPGAGREIDQTRARWYAALRDSECDPRPYDIVGDFWPYDGPYSQWTTAAAAAAIEQLVR